MGVLDLLKKMLSRSKLEMTENTEEKESIDGIPTRYGKRLDIGAAEKSRLVASLTPREKETFLFLLGGYSLKETAEQLGIGYSTTNTHQTAIYRKLHVNSRSELIINYRDVCEAQEKE